MAEPRLKHGKCVECRADTVLRVTWGDGKQNWVCVAHIRQAQRAVREA